MKRLLMVMEAGNYATLAQTLQTQGFEVAVETSSRRAMARLKTWQPDVLVADFYKRYFHDRVSNLESLLALASRHAQTRIVVIFDPFHAADLALLQKRHRIDATLALPLNQAAVDAALLGST